MGDELKDLFENAQKSHADKLQFSEGISFHTAIVVASDTNHCSNVYRIIINYFS